MAPDLTGAVAQEFFGVAWNTPHAQFLIPEGFPFQADLSGLRELGRKAQEVRVPQVLAGAVPGVNSRGTICGCFLWHQAELSLLCKRWGPVVWNV